MAIACGVGEERLCVPYRSEGPQAESYYMEMAFGAGEAHTHTRSNRYTGIYIRIVLCTYMYMHVPSSLCIRIVFCRDMYVIRCRRGVLVCESFQVYSY